MISISLTKESTFAMVYHKFFEEINVLFLDGPNLSKNVEEYSLGTRRSGERSLVAPSVIKISIFHESSQFYINQWVNSSILIQFKRIKKFVNCFNGFFGN
jgi:hypothetical protein